MSTHEPVVTQQILDLISSKSDEQRAAREIMISWRWQRARCGAGAGVEDT